MEPTRTVGEDTVEFAALDAPALAEVVRPGPMPFRSSAAELVDLFGTVDAGAPWWHRSRARELRRQAHGHPVACVTDAYLRLSARHLATARLLENDGAWAATV